MLVRRSGLADGDVSAWRLEDWSVTVSGETPVLSGRVMGHGLTGKIFLYSLLELRIIICCGVLRALNTVGK